MNEDFAFPFSVRTSDGGNIVIETYPGLTKREYYSAMAMQGMLTAGMGTVIEDSVLYADALISELAKTKEG